MRQVITFVCPWCNKIVTWTVDDSNGDLAVNCPRCDKRVAFVATRIEEVTA